MERIDTGRGGRLPVRRVAAIHDLSCFGRCALTVILPVLSAMGNQTVPVPTALLSSHTGGFNDLYFRDLTDSMDEIAKHFDRLSLDFDAVYTGFLGDERQIRLVEHFIERFADEQTLVMIDPVMGDDGKLYSTYTDQLCRGMRQLCRHADVLTPNLTEACILTDTPYPEAELLTEAEALSLSQRLCEGLQTYGASRIVITGLRCHGKSLGTYGYSEQETPNGFLYTQQMVAHSYPGTGELFASILLGMLLKGRGFEEAVRVSADMTEKTMRYTAQFDTPIRDGVAFEHFMGELAAL